VAVAVTETVPTEPAVIVVLVGESASATNSGGGGAVIVRTNVVVLVSTPEVPVIVTVVLPMGAFAATSKTTGSISPLDSVTLDGIAITPVGKPLIVYVTLPAKPLLLVTPISTGLLWPDCATVSGFGVAVMLKAGPVGAAALTVSCSVAVCDGSVPEVPTKLT
jgi:hypothetical protein